MAIELDVTVDVDKLPDDMQVLQKLVRRMETEMAELETRLDELSLEEDTVAALNHSAQNGTPFTAARTFGR